MKSSIIQKIPDVSQKVIEVGHDLTDLTGERDILASVHVLTELLRIFTGKT